MCCPFRNITRVLSCSSPDSHRNLRKYWMCAHESHESVFALYRYTSILGIRCTPQWWHRQCGSLNFHIDSKLIYTKTTSIFFPYLTLFLIHSLAINYLFIQFTRWPFLRSVLGYENVCGWSWMAIAVIFVDFFGKLHTHSAPSRTHPWSSNVSGRFERLNSSARSPTSNFRNFIFCSEYYWMTTGKDIEKARIGQWWRDCHLATTKTNIVDIYKK